MGWGMHGRRARHDDVDLFFGFAVDGDERADGSTGSRRKSCSSSGPWYVWLLFPLFFWLFPAFEDAGWAGVRANVESFGVAVAKFSPLGPLADIISRGVGVAFIEAYALLVAAAALNVTIAVLALRTPSRPA